MELSLFLAGIVVVHVLVWGMIRQLRREGQRLRRYHLATFTAIELVSGIVLVMSGSVYLLVWFAVNAAFVLLSLQLSPPRRFP
jgi:hypothetical protein